MTFRQVCDITNNQVLINLPADFKDKKQVTVVVDDAIDSKSKKLDLLKQALTDPLFLADVKEIHTDFDAADNETL